MQCAAGDAKGCCRVPRPLYETPNGEDLTFLLPDAPGGQVADCFATPGICSESTWCQIDTHESWAVRKSKFYACSSYANAEKRWKHADE